MKHQTLKLMLRTAALAWFQFATTHAAIQSLPRHTTPPTRTMRHIAFAYA